MNSSLIKIVIIILAILVLVFAFIFDLHTLISLEKVQAVSHSLLITINTHPISSFFMAFFLMALIYSLPLPIAALTSLTAGFFFNFFIGLLLVLSSSLLAALATFLISRYLVRDWIAKRFVKYMQIVDKEITTYGFLYALSIRTVPGIPFIALNTSLGITKLSMPAFCLSTILGMIPISAILVNAGKQLNTIESINDVLTPNLLVSLLLLACFPILIRVVKSHLAKRKI